jgi:hypothetical protein
LAPNWRIRKVVPLTTLAIRQQIIDDDDDLHLTELDKLLTEDEARALEDYAWCAQALAGAARTTDYDGDRIRTSRMSLTALPDKWMPRLRRHIARRLRLTCATRNVLDLFAIQQSAVDDAPTGAEIGLRLGLSNDDPAGEWWRVVKAAAMRLVAEGIPPRNSEKPPK